MPILIFAFQRKWRKCFEWNCVFRRRTWIGTHDDAYSSNGIFTFQLIIISTSLCIDHFLSRVDGAILHIWPSTEEISEKLGIFHHIDIGQTIIVKSAVLHLLGSWAGRCTVIVVMCIAYANHVNSPYSSCVPIYPRYLICASRLLSLEEAE